MKNLKDFILEAKKQYDEYDDLFSYFIEDLDPEEIYERTKDGNDIDSLANWIIGQCEDCQDGFDSQRTKVFKELKKKTPKVMKKLQEYVTDYLDRRDYYR